MTKRKTLKNGHGGKKQVDMEKVYKALDSGRSVKSVADEWQVSTSTLYRRHREYQAEIERNILENELPPLPDDVTASFSGKI